MKTTNNKSVADILDEEKKRMNEIKQQARADYLRPRICFIGIVGCLWVIGSLIIVRFDWKVVFP